MRGCKVRSGSGGAGGKERVSHRGLRVHRAVSLLAVRMSQLNSETG